METFYLKAYVTQAHEFLSRSSLIFDPEEIYHEARLMLESDGVTDVTEEEIYDVIYACEEQNWSDEDDEEEEP